MKIEANRCWSEVDAGFGDLRGEKRVDSAVAMASFVSLGVAAYEVAHAIAEGNQL